MAHSARTPRASMTIADFLVYPTPEGKAELVRGELRVTPPAGGSHGVVVSNVLDLLIPYVRAHSLGRVFGDGFGYELTELPRTVRVPDASFLRAERLPTRGFGRELFKGAPDLAVEVLSPSDTASRLDEKLADYAASRTPVIWIIDVERRTVAVIAAGQPAYWLAKDDIISGDEMLPGFSCPVKDLFAGVARGLD